MLADHSRFGEEPPLLLHPKFNIGWGIARCPECDGLFYRVRKQKYCNRPCVAKANWRAYMKFES